MCSHLGYPSGKREVLGMEDSHEILRQWITSVPKENEFKRGPGDACPNCGVGTSKRSVFILLIECAPAPCPSSHVLIPSLNRYQLCEKT